MCSYLLPRVRHVWRPKKKKLKKRKEKRSNLRQEQFVPFRYTSVVLLVRLCQLLGKFLLQCFKFFFELRFVPFRYTSVVRLVHLCQLLGKFRLQCFKFFFELRFVPFRYTPVVLVHLYQLLGMFLLQFFEFFFELRSDFPEGISTRILTKLIHYNVTIGFVRS